VHWIKWACNVVEKGSNSTGQNLKKNDW
jgi:hypothetical protein